MSRSIFHIFTTKIWRPGASKKKKGGISEILNPENWIQKPVKSSGWMQSWNLDIMHNAKIVSLEAEKIASILVAQVVVSSPKPSQSLIIFDKS